ncbi:MAG TPA: sulfate adenylyltransferase [Blastocatellia bacterium]|jgi:sulfate adenylyltransferase|nr:sulfate adenylyltransferase [Blastocatellia bacterium]
METISAHGGRLVNRELAGVERETLLERVPAMPRLTLRAREVSDLEMIANGAFSPLEGFMCEDDYVAVRGNKHLASGLPWTIPVTLSTSDEEGASLKEGGEVALFAEEEHLLGVLHLRQKFRYDKQREAERVYLTADPAHPGVRALFEQGEWLLGGPVSLLNRPRNAAFSSHRLDPEQTRDAFKKKGWHRIVAFQTRNPIHRAHEYIIKCALETVDGLLLHPLVGETKSDDIPADVRMRCYEAMLDHYFPKTRAMLAVNPAAMRYAGPREAVFHAIIRKNYGCTHFIVGRDHAGVGNYYGTYDAHYIFNEFDPESLGITPMFFDHSFYCRQCDSMASNKTCPHDSSEHVTLSGTKVREMLAAGQLPPREFSRPEVASILIDAMKER